jgi:5-methylcytosine-specific restriction endonuclease McrA
MTTLGYNLTEFVQTKLRGGRIVSPLEGELYAEIERLKVDKAQLEEGMALFRNRLQDAMLRIAVEEAKVKHFQVSLDIEKRVNDADTDRVWDMKQALQKMAAEVQNARLERDAIRKEANATRKQLEDKKLRTARPGRVPLEQRDSRTVNKQLRDAVIARDGGCCRYCGQGIEAGAGHIDHVYPHSMGGRTIIENLVLSCVQCNIFKGERIGVWPLPYEGVVVNLTTTQEPTP